MGQHLATTSKWIHRIPLIISHLDFYQNIFIRVASLADFTTQGWLLVVYLEGGGSVSLGGKHSRDTSPSEPFQVGKPALNDDYIVQEIGICFKFLKNQLWKCWCAGSVDCLHVYISVRNESHMYTQSLI